MLSLVLSRRLLSLVMSWKLLLLLSEFVKWTGSLKWFLKITTTAVKCLSVPLFYLLKL